MGFMDFPWWVGVAFLVILAWIVSLLLVRHWTKKRLQATFTSMEEKWAEEEISVEDTRPEDEQALELIRDYRRRYLLKLWPDTPLNFATINELSQSLIKDLAAIYHPEDERPELKASLADLVALYRRVGVRLSSWLETPPLRPLGEVELATLWRLHEAYQQVKNHKVYQFLKRHHLDRAARWLWAAYNVANPWYWGRRAAYTGSRELLARLFLAKVIKVVGEEAIRLYGRRSPNLRLYRRYQAGIQELINLALNGKQGLPPAALSYILQKILKAKGLEDQEKVALLRKLAAPRCRKVAPEGLEPQDRQEILKWLDELARILGEGPETRDRLAQVRKTWRHDGNKEPESLSPAKRS